MSLARGKFGIEFDPLRGDEAPSGRGLFIFAAVLIVLISFTVTLVKRLGANDEELALERAERAPVTEAAKAVPASLPAPPLAPAVPPEKAALASRSRTMRNLLMRLTEAERDRDLSRQVETIELLRALPGNPAADIDHLLVKRLGRLNYRWMFGDENSPWTSRLTPRRGNSAERIAKEQGMTLAALLKLNHWRSTDELRPNESVRVFNRPNFVLIVHRRSRLAELMLDGKLFKAYELAQVPRVEPGLYQATDDLKQQFTKLDLAFTAPAQSELKLFLLASAPILIAEY